MPKLEMTKILTLVLGALLAVSAADPPTDMTALTTMLQHQAAVIQTMEARLTALENQESGLDSQLTSLNAAHSALANDVTHIADDVQEMRNKSSLVAFTAHMSDTHVHVGDNPFIFNVETNNVGGGYDIHTGIFTAPRSGLYVFHFVIVNDNHWPFIRVALMQGGRVLGVGTVDAGPENVYDDGSALVTTRLMAGDTVYVKRDGGASVIYGDNVCNFSGFLVMPDM